MLGGGELVKQVSIFGFGYNRTNYQLDQGQRWARYTAGRANELKRFAMFRVLAGYQSRMFLSTGSFPGQRDGPTPRKRRICQTASTLILSWTDSTAKERMCPILPLCQ